MVYLPVSDTNNDINELNHFKYLASRLQDSTLKWSCHYPFYYHWENRTLCVSHYPYYYHWKNIKLCAIVPIRTSWNFAPCFHAFWFRTRIFLDRTILSVTSILGAWRCRSLYLCPPSDRVPFSSPPASRWVRLDISSLSAGIRSSVPFVKFCSNSQIILKHRFYSANSQDSLDGIRPLPRPLLTYDSTKSIRRCVCAPT
jgi:hypothetical protein